MDISTENYTNLSTDGTPEAGIPSDLTTTTLDEISKAIDPQNIFLINVSQQFRNESQFISPVFEGFIAAEILMTALELVIALVAALTITGWRKNYRNQMLMQLSVARFVKRAFFYVQYLNEKGAVESSVRLQVTLISSQIYIDFVIAILVCFFMKHMYDSVLIVIVKISRGSFYRVLTCSWLVPIPISAMSTSIIVNGLLDKWWCYFIVCCIFRWPLMFLSTTLYIIILYRVLRDSIRKYARSLMIVIFLLCLIVNFYLLFKDIIELWCFKSYTTILVSYVLGFSLNSLILCLYAILICLNYHSNLKHNLSYSERNVVKEIK